MGDNAKAAAVITPFGNFDIGIMGRSRKQPLGGVIIEERSIAHRYSGRTVPAVLFQNFYNIRKVVDPDPVIDFRVEREQLFFESLHIATHNDQSFTGVFLFEENKFFNPLLRFPAGIVDESTGIEEENLGFFRRG
jgi:hypothetical protein